MYYLKTFETTEEYNKKDRLLVPSISLTEDDGLLHFDAVSDVVDLGLTSGTLWMKRNIGATSETDYGLYFQWGDTVGYVGDEAKAHSTWSTCPGNGGYSDANGTSLKAWDSTNLTNGVLNTDVDAAYVHTEGIMKMPTFTQCQELFNETDHSWVNNFNGSRINGMKFVNKTDSSKYIFIPASGHVNNDSFYMVGSKSNVWSDSMQHLGSRQAYEMAFRSNSNYMNVGDRNFGRCVRGILAF